VKVAIYARVSLDEKADDKRYQEPENQLQPLREYCKAREFVVTKEYVDKASGGDCNRPNFQKMLSDAHQRAFDAIIVWKLDRFSRERMSNTLNYLQTLKRYGVGVVSMTESWCDTTKDNPAGDLILAIFAWMGAEERRRISERTKAGIAMRRAIGQWRGGRPKKKREGVEANPESIGELKTRV
jgi:DNA invertase Pin-like site-specific DNA recombinase